MAQFRAVPLLRYGVVAMGSRKKVKESAVISIKKEMISLLIISLGILLLISLQTQSAGQFGKLFRNTLFGLFSWPANLLPYIIIYFGISAITGKNNRLDIKSKAALFVIYLNYLSLYSISLHNIINDLFFTYEGYGIKGRVIQIDNE